MKHQYAIYSQSIKNLKSGINTAALALTDLQANVEQININYENSAKLIENSIQEIEEIKDFLAWIII